MMRNKGQSSQIMRLHSKHFNFCQEQPRKNSALGGKYVEKIKWNNCFLVMEKFVPQRYSILAIPMKYWT